MLSFMLCPKTGLCWSLRAQKSSLDWKCHLLAGRYCWMRSTKLSCLLFWGLKRCMLCCLLMCGGHRWEFLISKFVNNVRFFNILNIARPPGLLELLPIAERRFGSWSMDFITGLPSCANGCNEVFTCVDHLTKYTVLTACTLGAGDLSAKQVAQLLF